MKVLSNLLGNDTKINANVIALKDKNDNGYTLDGEKVILYNDSTGTNGNITLEDNIENYRFYEIYFSREGNNYSSIRMSTDFLTNIQLLVAVYLGNITRLYTDSITISGTSLTRNYSRYINFPDSPATYNVGANTGLLIYKVIGYK
ncbi:MAG: hypothetical protein IJI58_05095 [Bacilli bacterium]|nr:hypothetical protein [Bacilli bacterium]